MNGALPIEAAPTCVQTRNLNLYYGSKHALKGVDSQLAMNSITALIGPSGCGKSTFLRCLNRMNDLIDNVKIEGEVLLDEENIYARGVDVVGLRQRIGMVFQKPNPFPMSIFDNVAYGPRLRGARRRSTLETLVEESLRGAALWGEVKDDLKKSALALSGGQQQRLCIARALATKPEVLLMDEPCSALDPISTLKIEELMRELKEKFTIVIVTHNMQQAARVSDATGFFLLGELARKMVGDALLAFVSHDVETAIHVARAGDAVDDLCDQVQRDLLDQMRADPSRVEPLTRLLLAARTLERVADHATNIVEYIYYVETGEMRPLAREEHGHSVVPSAADHHKHEVIDLSTPSTNNSNGVFEEVRKLPGE